MPGTQTITRLSPVAAVLAAMEEIRPVPAARLPLADAAGCVLAEDVVAAKRPSRALSLLDGWAVLSDETRDAGSYAPAPLGGKPAEVSVGDPMPENADAVAPFEAVKLTATGGEISEPVTGGENVLDAGADFSEGAVLRKSGERIGSIDAAVFESIGISEISVRRPKIRVVAAGASDLVRAARSMIVRDIVLSGGIVLQGGDLDSALRAADADALVVIGGSGASARDRSVSALANAGRVSMHGVALAPGETSAFGFASGRPVLILQGRLDAAIAGWIVLGRNMLARLQGRAVAEPKLSATLSRKVSSAIGMTEFVPVVLKNGSAEPLATKYLPLAALSRAQGWILVPPESEGYPAGTAVSVGMWP